ncbi:MAG TPA: glycosyltransferase family 39 protein [Candidatus Bathyarchaeia archaeon]|nr:glycosyltransferase family 39 protein [Candidatus Bathyarchaeia archaeon]
MFAILPLTPLIFLFFIFRRNNENRTAILKTHLAWGGLAILSAEMLSLVNALTAFYLGCFWAAINLGIISYCFHQRLWPSREEAAVLWKHFSRNPVYWIIAGVALAALGLALFTPPNNTDAMVYHLPRIEHWIANHSLRHFATWEPRQLWTPPGAEILIAHLRIFTPRHELANLIQWLAMIISLVGMSGIAALLGFSPKIQRLTALFCVTLPMGMMQATSTQNDYVATAWLVCFAYFLLSGRERMTARIAFWAGAALGLALLTKGVAYFVGFGLFFLIFWRKEPKQVWRQRATCFYLILVLALGLNAGHLARNIRLGGHPLDPFRAPEYKTTNMNLGLFLANATRNIAMHVGLFPQSAGAVSKGVTAFDKMLGVPDAAEHISFSKNAFAVYPWNFNEDVDGNPIHFLLLIIGGIALLFRKDVFRSVWPYGAALCLSAAVFILLSRWQPWVTRFHLPFFILASPLAVLAYEKKGRAIAISVIFLLTAIPYLLLNGNKPLLGKDSIFKNQAVDVQFIRAQDLKRGFVRGTTWVCKNDCPSEIGLIMPGGEWEYPLWRLLKQCRSDVHLQSITVTNISKNLRPGPYTPPMIIASNSDHGLNFKTRLSHDGAVYVRVKAFFPLVIFQRDDDGTLLRKNFEHQLPQVLAYAAPVSAWSEPINFDTILDGLDQAENLDMDLLEKAFPGLGESYKTVFLPALRKRATGLIAAQPQRYEEAQRETQVWVKQILDYQRR